MKKSIDLNYILFSVQPHLRKCFEGIHSLRFNEDLEVLAMRSTEGEEVDLIETISTLATRGQVEKWLIELERIMRLSIRNEVYLAIQAYPTKERRLWVLDWPGQTILCVGKTYWTLRIEQSMLLGIEGLYRYLDQCQKELNEIILLIRGILTKQNRITLGGSSIEISIFLFVINLSIKLYTIIRSQRLWSRWTSTGKTLSRNCAKTTW